MNGHVSISIRPFLGPILHLRTRRIIGNRKWLGSFIALACALWLWQLPAHEPLNGSAMHFLATLAGAAFLWAFNVFDEYVVALLLLLSWIVFGIVPPEKALTGFAKESWFFILGSFGIGATLASSGVLQRAALKILAKIPPGYKAYTLILLSVGFLATPFLPNVKARILIVAPIVREICVKLGLRPGSNGYAGLSLAAYIGFSQATFVFLTGATVTIAGWGLLPEASRIDFDWVTWTLAALPAGLFTFLFLFGAIHFFFPLKDDEKKLFSPDIDFGVRDCKPLSHEAWLSSLIAVLAFTGWISKPVHGISEAWIAMGALVALLAVGVLDRDDFKKKIDWAFLVFFGVAYSIAAVCFHLQLDRWLIAWIDPVLRQYAFHPVPFLTAVLILVYVVRFFLLKTPAVILLTFLFSSWAQEIHIHPGVVLITALMAVETWFLPYQNPSYAIAYQIAEKKGFSHGQARKLMVAKLFASLLAILISIPYWRMLGLL